jgi:hypothetical protein
VSNIEVKSGDTVNIVAAQSGSTILKVDQEATAVGVSAVKTDAHYTHTQSVPSSEWTIQHNLGKRSSVTVVDSTDAVVFGDINYVDSNNVTITFNGAFSGKAYFN